MTGEGALLINFNHHIKSRLTLTCKEQHSASGQWWAPGTRARTESCCPNQPKRGALVLLMGRFPIPICYLGFNRITLQGWQWKCNRNVPGYILSSSSPEIAEWTLAGHRKLEILKSRVGPIKSSCKGWERKLMGGDDLCEKWDPLAWKWKVEFPISMSLFKSEFLFFT